LCHPLFCEGHECFLDIGCLGLDHRVERVRRQVGDDGKIAENRGQRILAARRRDGRVRSRRR
jgi:hypothetical protein